jgi:hypothetical protein
MVDVYLLDPEDRAGPGKLGYLDALVTLCLLV